MRQVPYFEATNDLPVFVFRNKRDYDEWASRKLRNALMFQEQHKQRLAVAAHVRDHAICVAGSSLVLIPMKYLKQVE